MQGWHEAAVPCATLVQRRAALSQTPGQDAKLVLVHSTHCPASHTPSVTPSATIPAQSALLTQGTQVWVVVLQIDADGSLQSPLATQATQTLRATSQARSGPPAQSAELVHSTQRGVAPPRHAPSPCCAPNRKQSSLFAQPTQRPAASQRDAAGEAAHSALSRQSTQSPSSGRQSNRPPTVEVQSDSWTQPVQVLVALSQWAAAGLVHWSLSRHCTHSPSALHEGRPGSVQ
jgi:hypothetical protein